MCSRHPGKRGTGQEAEAHHDSKIRSVLYGLTDICADTFVIATSHVFALHRFIVYSVCVLKQDFNINFWRNLTMVLQGVVAIQRAISFLWK